MPQKIPGLFENVYAAKLRMARTQLIRIFCFLMVLFSTNPIAAGNTLIPNDSNSRIVVENAVVKGNKTTVFFYTYPDLGDPNSGKSCPLNYYSATFQPGLTSARTDVVARGVCGAGLFQKSRLLDNGDALIIVRDRLERWRAGEQINSRTFSSIDAVSKLGVTTDMTGGQFYDISPNGDVVLLIRSGDSTYDRDEYRGSSMVMTGLKPDGGRSWEERFSGDPTLITVKQVWAAPGGSALLYMSSLANGLADAASQLHFISTNGSRKSIELNQIGEPVDMESLGNMSQQEVQALFAQQRNSKPESIKKLDAVARADGGFDVLFHREGGEEGREGFFLYRVEPDGSLISEIALGNRIKEHGLERWFDFYVDGGQLVLLSRVFATQQGVQAKRKGWAQNVVSWIDLDTGMPVSRLIPLDSRYLEAAMNAGDEQRQYLDGLPGGEPALLTTLGGVPLSVSVGSISKRPALRINEATDQLMAYTEAHDKKQAKIAKEESRKQRKADREARQHKMNAEMAAAVGMTPEEYAALSNKERKEAMVRNGDMDAMMAAAMKQAQDVQQAQEALEGMSNQQAAMPPDMNAQMASAMAEMEEKMANDPNMTPQMRAQMSAMMGQMGQSPGGQVTGSPGLPGAQSPVAPAQNVTGEADVPENTLKVDSGKRGFIEYQNKDGRFITLLIFNRQTGEELLKKDYPDGVIYEYVDFNRFNLPLQHIGVIYREVAGLVLEDLTPVVTQ
jgi:hypothetical protein